MYYDDYEWDHEEIRAERRAVYMADWRDYAETQIKLCRNLTDLRACLTRLEREIREEGAVLEEVLDLTLLPVYSGPCMAPDRDAYSWDDSNVLIPGVNAGEWEIIQRND